MLVSDRPILCRQHAPKAHVVQRAAALSYKPTAARVTPNERGARQGVEIAGHQRGRDRQTMLYDDAFDRLGQLRSNTQQLVKDYNGRDQRGPAALLKKILLAFELRWKLEELVLMPALKDTQGVMLCGTRDAERELAALRDLAGLAREDGLSAGRQRVLLSAIDTLAALRTQRVSLALTRAQRASVVDTRALGLEMDQLLKRWHGEVRRTGDTEDEEMDAVGVPPAAVAPMESSQSAVGEEDPGSAADAMPPRTEQRTRGSALQQAGGPNRLASRM